MAISDQLERIIKVLDEMNETSSSGYGMSMEDKVYFISTQLEKMKDDGFGDLPIHIEANVEYDEETGYPIIDNPEENQFYLLPSSDGEEGNMFDVWVYVGDGRWERFDAGGKVIVPAQEQADWNTTDTDSKAYIKNKPSIKSGTGLKSIKEGYNTTASGDSSHAEGCDTTAYFANDHAEGNKCVAGKSSGSGTGNNHAEGYQTTASGGNSHAEGADTTASGGASHAEGGGTKASGDYSHVEGTGSTASGAQSHAEGGGTTASGSNSHAEGSYTVANHASQHVFGSYNIPDSSSAAATSNGTYIEIVGNGSTSNTRSNARTLDWTGNEWIAGNMTVGGGTLTIGSTSITEDQLQADWNENDSSSKAYIKNKPELIDEDYLIQKNVLIKEDAYIAEKASISMTQQRLPGTFAWMYTTTDVWPKIAPSDLDEDRKYTIEFDDDSYICDFHFTDNGYAGYFNFNVNGNVSIEEINEKKIGIGVYISGDKYRINVVWAACNSGTHTVGIKYSKDSVFNATVPPDWDIDDSNQGGYIANKPPITYNSTTRVLNMNAGNITNSSTNTFTKNGFAYGSQNVSNGATSVLFGLGNISNSDLQTIVGSYNEEVPEEIDASHAYRFIVGGGYKSGQTTTRRNAMTVTADGTVTVRNSIVIGQTSIDESQLQALLALLNT